MYGRKFATCEQGRQAVMDWMVVYNQPLAEIMAEPPQSDAVRRTMVRGTAQKSRLNRGLRTPRNRDKVTSSGLRAGVFGSCGERLATSALLCLQVLYFTFETAQIQSKKIRAV